MIKIFDVRKTTLLGRAEECELVDDKDFTGILKYVELTKVINGIYRIELNGYKVKGLYSQDKNGYLKVKLEEGIQESECLAEVKFKLFRSVVG